jgi:hypothetical protein
LCLDLCVVCARTLLKLGVLLAPGLVSGLCTVFELRLELPLELCSNLGLGPSPRFGVGVCAPCLSCVWTPARTLLEFGAWSKPQVWCRGLCTVFELRLELPFELCSNLGLGPSPRFGVGVCAPCLSCGWNSRSNSARIWGLVQAPGLVSGFVHRV